MVHFFDEPTYQRTPELGEISLTLDDLSNLYNAPVDKLRTLFDEKERVTKYDMSNNGCWENNFVDFFYRKISNLGRCGTFLQIDILL